MKQIYKNLLIVLFIGIIFFYGVPIAATFSAPIVAQSIAATSLLIINPLYSIISAHIFTAKHGFKWYLPFLIALLFIPAVYILYNDSALVYAAAYGILALLSSLIRAAINSANKKRAL